MFVYLRWVSCSKNSNRYYKRIEKDSSDVFHITNATDAVAIIQLYNRSYFNFVTFYIPHPFTWGYKPVSLTPGSEWKVNFIVNNAEVYNFSASQSGTNYTDICSMSIYAR